MIGIEPEYADSEEIGNICCLCAAPPPPPPPLHGVPVLYTPPLPPGPPPPRTVTCSVCAQVGTV